MSPEQARGEAVTPLSDLFILGGVLYQMLTGRPPFEGPSALSVLLAITLKPPPAPSTLNPDLSPALSRLTMRLLSQAAEGRPTSAREVVGAIEALERDPVINHDKAKADREAAERLRREGVK